MAIYKVASLWKTVHRQWSSCFNSGYTVIIKKHPVSKGNTSH